MHKRLSKRELKQLKRARKHQQQKDRDERLRNFGYGWRLDDDDDRGPSPTPGTLLTDGLDPDPEIGMRDPDYD